MTSKNSSAAAILVLYKKLLAQRREVAVHEWRLRSLRNGEGENLEDQLEIDSRKRRLTRLNATIMPRTEGQINALRRQYNLTRTF